jgi:hypothetical protein
MGMRYPSRRDYARRTGTIAAENDEKIGLLGDDLDARI